MSALRILVGDHALRVPLEAVEVILRTPTMTTVPATPPALAGLFNYQGAVYPAVHPIPGETSSGRHSVIVRTRVYGRFALLCDWAEDLDAEGGDLLDLDALARSVIAAYPTVEANIQLPPDPSAVIRLRARPYTEPDATA